MTRTDNNELPPDFSGHDGSRCTLRWGMQGRGEKGKVYKPWRMIKQKVVVERERDEKRDVKTEWDVDVT